ncbi:MAG: RDD family protein [Elusimicrobiaceae bacterium]|jgi:uncharacterized RDD family membrane protein YckC|nr:RDD family protein [Elusimicrobiaceae bacterium]MBT3955644.1 RDD family protein [Elusimicrobiaceae bacterium]MBT4403403.1 RDD family protein [Elusimicrobiaceae bacterium]MBT4439708.1 RDD family protein [Elusimicrobiaceae bacterium]MBT5987138.1 RDD family protein [Elusimicrobiaceae bacterium]
MQQINTNLDTSVPSARTQYALFLERALAFAIDYFPFPMLGLFTLITLYKKGYNFTLAQDALCILGFLFLFIIYHAIFNSGGRVSLGKFLMGIKVITLEDQPLTFKKAFIRGFVILVEAFTFFIGFVFAIFTKNKQAVHDMVVNSTVISTREKTTTEILVVSIAGTILCAALILTKYYAFFLAPSLQEKIALAKASQQLDQIALLQYVHKEEFGYYTNDVLRLSLMSGDTVQFQRDMQNSFYRKGFRMGAGEDDFSITGYAKDGKRTEVHYSSKNAK